MIRLNLTNLDFDDDARAMLQMAIGVEFGTLPPYLYALYSIKAGTNVEATQKLRSVGLQEMIHMCLVCNMLNALGGDPIITPQAYPAPLPGDIGAAGQRLTLHLLPFSKAAVKQGMDIEQPEDIPDIPVAEAVATGARVVTIGQYYRALDDYLATLPEAKWQRGRNQITDDQFFAGQIYPIGSYADAHKAIGEIVSEGEGAKNDPIDFQGEYAHYYRFGELYNERTLTKANNPQGYTWGPSRIGVDYDSVYPAISDPGLHDFSVETPGAQAAQSGCNQAFSQMIDALHRAVAGKAGALGEAVRSMYRLRMASIKAFQTPLRDGGKVAGPAFIYTPS